MRRVKLREYPKFWDDLVERVNESIDPSGHVSGALLKLWIKEWYNMDVYITSNGKLAEVHMHDAEYTAFLLRWS